MDVVQEAESIINSLIFRNNRGYDEIPLTMSQLRKFLTAVNVLNNKVMADKIGQADRGDELSPDLAAEIQYLKVKLLYQAGRDRNGNNVKRFLEKSRMLERISDIGNSRKKYEEFAKLIEAIVAWHKFKGGAQ